MAKAKSKEVKRISVQDLIELAKAQGYELEVEQEEKKSTISKYSPVMVTRDVKYDEHETSNVHLATSIEQAKKVASELDTPVFIILDANKAYDSKEKNGKNGKRSWFNMATTHGFLNETVKVGKNKVDIGISLNSTARTAE